MLYNLTSYGILAVNGQDAAKLLQGQLTCDVLTLQDGHSCMGAQCNQQGRIISLFYLVKIQTGFYLVMPRDLIPIALAALKKYAVFYKVALSDQSAYFNLIGCDNIADVQIEDKLIITLPANPLAIILSHAALPDCQDYSAWKVKCIEAGIPTIYPETSEKFLPHELNLQTLGAIDFNKGCYTGQEIIARMHYRGTLKKQMIFKVLTSETIPERGMVIPGADDEPSYVVDAALIATNQYAALVLEKKSL